MRRSIPASCSPSISNLRPARPAARRLAGLLVAGGAALLTACAGAKVPQPTAKSVEYAERNGQTTTLASLKHGRTLYVGRCSACHALHQPKDFGPASWPKLVEDMQANAQVNPDQLRDITAYLVAVSAQMQDSLPAPSPAHPGAGAAP